MNYFSSTLMPICLFWLCFLFCFRLVYMTNDEITVQSFYDDSGMLESVDFFISNQRIAKEDWSQLEQQSNSTSFILFDTSEQTGLIAKWFQIVLSWIPCKKSDTSGTLGQRAYEIGFPNRYLNSKIAITLDKRLSFDEFYRMSLIANRLLKEHARTIQTVMTEMFGGEMNFESILGTEQEIELFQKIMETCFEQYLARVLFVFRALSTTLLEPKQILTSFGLTKVLSWRFQLKSNNNSHSLDFEVYPLPKDASDVAAFNTLQITIKTKAKFQMTWDLNLQRFCERLLSAGVDFLIDIKDPFAKELDRIQINMSPIDQLHLIVSAFIKPGTNRQFAFIADNILYLLDQYLRANKLCPRIPLPQYYNNCFHLLEINLDSDDLVLGIKDIKIYPAVIPIEKCHAKSVENKINLKSLKDEWVNEAYTKIMTAAQNKPFQKTGVEIVGKYSIPSQIRAIIFCLLIKNMPFKNVKERNFNVELDFPASYDVNETIQFARNNLWPIMQQIFPPKFNLKAILANKNVWNISMYFSKETRKTYMEIKLNDIDLETENQLTISDIKVLDVSWKRYFEIDQLNTLTAWSMGELTASDCLVLIFEGLAHFMYLNMKKQIPTLKPIEWYQEQIQREFPSTAFYRVNIDKVLLILVAGRLPKMFRVQFNGLTGDTKDDQQICNQMIQILKTYMNLLEASLTEAPKPLPETPYHSLIPFV